MDYAARWPEPHPPPQHHHPSYNHYAAPPSQPHHLNLLHLPHPQQPLSYSSSSPASFYPNPSPHHPNPYAPHGGYSVGPDAGAGAGAGGALAAYYYERIGAEPHVFAVKEATRQYGTDHVGYVPVPPRPYNGLDHIPPRPYNGLDRPYNGLDVSVPPPYVVPPQQIAKPNYEGGTNKAPKTTKVVQSAYCGVCKIDCNSQEVLNTHKQGKRHKKNLQKLQELITPKPQRAQATTKPAEKKGYLVPDKGKGEGSKQTKRKEAPEEDLETKKKKILEGGAEPNEVKVCTICNVVVNSEKVYYSHIAGSKHAAMVKKQREAGSS